MLCNFEPNVKDLQSLSEKRAENPLVKKKSMPLYPYISDVIWSTDGSTFFLLDAHDQVLFKRYRDRTLLTIGGLPMVDAYGNLTLRAAFRVSCRHLRNVCTDFTDEKTNVVRSTPA